MRGLSQRKCTLQISSPALRRQLKLALAYPSPCRITPCAACSLQLRSAPLQFSQRRIRQQHRLVITTLPLLSRKQRHSNHQSTLQQPCPQESLSPGPASRPTAEPLHASAHTSADAPSPAAHPRRPHRRLPGQTPAATIRQGEHSRPSTGNCPAYRTPSISSASPQRPHNVCDCVSTPQIQASQTGANPARSSGPPQALQSAGKKVVTRSSTTARATLPGLRNTRDTARHSPTPPGGPPGGAPVVLPSALSFKHSLKTHLTRQRSRSARTAPFPAV